jgi:threonine dehydrogenase-like Zn-dependent dehydrogenase
MRATLMYEAGDVRIDDVPDPSIVEPTDAVIRVTRASICGSDLWPYASLEPTQTGRPMGHEAIGVVEDVGAEVRNIKVGDLAVMPFAFSDGTCTFCSEGLHTACVHGGFFDGYGTSAAQAEAVRVPLADGTLFPLPVGEDDPLMRALLTLTDVMGTGHHAAVVAGVTPGKIAAVVGDGAVGLCGVIAAKRLGAEQIIILGRHEDRIALAREFGATDVVSERGEAAVERVNDLTGGFGAHSVLECVGHGQALETAVGIARPGGAVGRVGVPQEETMPRIASGVLRQCQDRRRAGAGACLHQGAAPGYPRGQDRARQGLRPHRRPRWRAGRLSGHGGARVDQGDGRAMTAWTDEQLDRIGTAQELGVASLRADGTLCQPVTIWVVREGDDPYVRSWRGRTGAWYRGVQERHRGHIRAGGVDKDVPSSRSMTRSRASGSTPPIGPSTAGTGRATSSDDQP